MLSLLPQPEIIISHSQAETWDRCGFKWHISYELGYAPIERSRGLELGGMIHELFAIWYETRDESLVDAQVQKWVEEYTSGISNGHSLPSVASAVWLFKKYIHEYPDNPDRYWKILAVEKHFAILLTSPAGHLYILQGYIDLIIEIDGKIWIVDHKSGQKFWNDGEAMMDSQLPLYAAALRHQGLEVFGIIINLIGTYPYKDKTKVKNEQVFKTIQMYRSPSELDAVLNNTGLIVDEIIERRNPLRRSLKKDCDKCWAQEACLMSMKGINLVQYLDDTARKKDSYRVDEEAVPETQTEIEVLFG